ncbi:tRNA lysidine(34) synthetase TilS [Thermodesulfobacteriota bacterium]
MQKDNKTKNRVKNTILKFKMLRPGDRVVVAVSGGPDSVCLLDIMVELSASMDIDLIIAHYNHGLRNSEDDNENRLVEKLAAKYGLPIECERASDLESSMASLEEMARDSRYAFLKKVKSKHKADKISLGHNLNDQAETFLMRLLRGSGMTGLSGIPPVRDEVFIRPLIETGREEILDYLDCHQIEYTIDSSNSDKKFLRNRIRLELIPELIKYQPNLVENLGNLSSHLREENEFINLQAEKWVEEELRTERSDGFHIGLTVFNKLPNVFSRRVLRLIISRFIKYLHGVDAGHIDSIIKLSKNPNPNASIHLPKGLIVKKEYNNLVFSLDEDQLKPFNYIIREPGTVYIEETGQKISIETTGRPKEKNIKKTEPGTELINGDRIQFPLTVRNYEPGDRFIPLGMKGRKKVKDYFIDMKVPLRDRKLAPILLFDDKIVWICGHRIDDRFKMTPDTKTILKCNILGTGIPHRNLSGFPDQVGE